MTDIDRLLEGTLRDHAQRAPDGETMLCEVHLRSQRVRRRRRVTTLASTLAAVLAVGVPVAMAGIVGGVEPHPGASQPVASQVAGSDQPSTLSSTSAAASAGPSGRPSGAALRFDAPTFTEPSMPLRLPDGRAGEFEAPVVTVQDGAVVAYYATRAPVEGADVTLVVTSQRPAFAATGARVSEVTRRVRSKSGTLRTVAVSPAATVVVYWQESQTRWVQVRTDDTFTPDEVVAFAESLVSAKLPVVVPLRLDLAPAGGVLWSTTPFGMAFRGVTGQGGTPSTVLSCTVVTERPLTGATVNVGERRATLRRGTAGAVLTVAVPDWRVTLTFEVPAKVNVTDAELIRFAAGVHLTDSAETREASAGGIGAPID